MSDARAIFALVGECRELGDDRVVWRQHLLDGLARAIDADLGLAGEMAGCRGPENIDLGVTFWWPAGFPKPAFLDDHMENFRRKRHYSPAMLEYHRLNASGDGASLTRRDFITDRDWYHSHDYRMIQEPLGIDTTLWCFRQIEGIDGDESSALILARAKGRGDFGPRDRAIVREAQAAIGPLVGGALSRFSEPSPSDLPPRPRRVLACLLEGDADRQIADRLDLSRLTVNQYVKKIFRHFGVQSRAQLQIRWIRRRWGDTFAWSDHRDFAARTWGPA